MFELGSIFKTFTIALALDEKLVEPNTLINGIEKKLNVLFMKYLTLKIFLKQ